jgi:hypothetical protein
MRPNRILATKTIIDGHLEKTLKILTVGSKACLVVKPNS